MRGSTAVAGRRSSGRLSGTCVGSEPAGNKGPGAGGFAARPRPPSAPYTFARRSRLALVTTVTEEVAIAASARTGCIQPITARGIITTL